jgi:hypothetical protein
MRNLFLTIAMLLFIGTASAQTNPQTNKKAKSKTDTISTSRTTKSGVEKKSTTTTKTHTTKTHPKTTKKTKDTIK